MVVTIHSYAAFLSMTANLGGAVVASMQRGVELFFILSAFTLCMSWSSRRAETRPVLNFYLRRIFRIVPMFYLCLILNLLVHGTTGFNAWQIGSEFLLLHNLSPHANNSVVPGTWSIGVEVLFYLLLPILLPRIRSWQRALQLTLLASVLLAAGCLTMSWHFLAGGKGELGEYAGFTGFPVQFPVFCMGIFAYFAWQKLQPAANLWTPERRAELSAVLLVGSAVLWISNLNVSFAHPSRLSFNNTHLYTASFAFVPLLLAMMLHPWRLLDNVALRLIGKVSYSIYLTHFYVIAVILRYWHPAHPGPRTFATVWGSTFSVAMVVSVCCWHRIEQPGIRLGRLLIGAIEHRFAPSRPYPDLIALGSTPDQQF